MKINKDELKGIVFVFLSALSISSVYIIGRLAQSTLKTSNFLFFWFFLASIWVTLFMWKTGLFNDYKRIFIKNIKFFAIFSIIEAVATFLFFYLIKVVNPSVVSFIGNINPLFVILWGFILIGERLNVYEIIGGAISLSGALLISYKTPELSLKYFLLIILMVLLYSFNSVFVKKNIKNISSFLLTGVRVYFLTTIYFIFALFEKGFRLPLDSEWLYIVGGSLLGPFMGMFFLFESFKFIKVSKASLIKTVQPLLVVLGTFLILKIKISFSQFVGGILIIIGIIILIISSKLAYRPIGERAVK